MDVDKRIIAAIIIIAICVVGFSVYFFVLRKNNTTKSTRKTTTTKAKTKISVKQNTKYKEMYQKCIKYFGKNVEKIVPYDWFVKAIKFKNFLKEKFGNISSFYLNITSSTNNSNYTVEMYMDGYAYGPNSMITANINPEKYSLFFSKVTLSLIGSKATYTKIMYTMMNNSTLIMCERTTEPIKNAGFCAVKKISNKTNAEKFKLWILLFYGYLLKNNMIKFYNTTKGTTIVIKITKVPNITVSNITIPKTVPITVYINYTKSGLNNVVFLMNGVKMVFRPSNITPKEILEKINSTIEEFKNSGAKFVMLNNTTTNTTIY